MLNPAVHPDFPIVWGFSTRLDDLSQRPPRRLSQVHGTRIVEALSAGSLPEADGQWTLEKGLRIGVRVADCVPVLLAGMTPQGPWAAALHAGWRGAVGGNGSGQEPGILRCGVEIFHQMGGDPGQLYWALGPSIQRCHFEVGPEVIEAARKDHAWHDGLAQGGPRARPHLDLHGFLRAQAHDLGLTPARDGSLPRCTCCESELLYSYRHGDKEGRQWGWVELL